MKRFICLGCGQNLPHQLRGLGTSFTNSVCQRCADDGVRPGAQRVLGKICPDCGTHHNNEHCLSCGSEEHRTWKWIYAKKAVVSLLLRQQGYRCVGCRVIFHGHYKVDEPREDAFCIDHNHRTGLIRGLLCHRCNYALGVASDDPEQMLTLPLHWVLDEAVRPRLARYLQGKGTEVRYDPFIEDHIHKMKLKYEEGA